MSAEAWGFASLALTTAAGFGGQWLQTKRNHRDNVELLGSCVIGVNEFREHMVEYHGAAPVQPLVIPRTAEA